MSFGYLMGSFFSTNLLHPVPFQTPTQDRRERTIERKGGGNLIKDFLLVGGIEFLGASLIFLIRISPTSSQQPAASSQKLAASIRGAAATTAPNIYVLFKNPQNSKGHTLAEIICS